MAQYHVDLYTKPTVVKSGSYAMWVLSKERLHFIIENFGKTTWAQRNDRPDKCRKSGHHMTAIARQAVPAPIRMLNETWPLSGGDIFYDGCGDDKPGSAVLRKRATGLYVEYDPHHPYEALSMYPEGHTFNEIHSHYVLNVVDRREGLTILKKMYDACKPDGVVYISVRRDI